MKKLLTIGLLALACGIAPLDTGCTQAQAANILQTIQQDEQYVTDFIQGAEAVWAVISPLLGAQVAPAANAAFAAAIQTATNAQLAGENLVAAAQAANQPLPSITLILADVQAAIPPIVSIIAQYTSAPSSHAGVSLTALQKQAAVIVALR